jgi:serine/threonine-protein kinase
MALPARVKVRSRLGKYRIERCLAEGRFADVFQAYDTVEGIRVALKIPQPDYMDAENLEDFKKEVRLTARLDHPHILPIKNANFVDGRFVLVYHLGQGSLGDRLTRRISLAKALSYAEQVLAGLACAHDHRILHGDVKPENFILFQDRVRLADFGIAKVALRTLEASGSGTIGYMAPEQALGKPSLRSDVFAAGLVLYRLFTGVVPEWPFEWPPPGSERLRRLHPDLVAVLRRALRLDPRQRFRDAGHMLEAFRAAKPRALALQRSRQRRARKGPRTDWRELRRKHFARRYRSVLEAVHECGRCSGPVSEAMLACPWCAAARPTHRGATALPARCPRCRRGLKLDWRFCPWCYGESIGPRSEREFSDRRYSARCPNRACSRRSIWPFMRYCPWCRTKLHRRWPIPDSRERCPHCRWGALPDYWKVCPWCTRPIGHGAQGARRNSS